MNKKRQKYDISDDEIDDEEPDIIEEDNRSKYPRLPIRGFKNMDSYVPPKATMVSNNTDIRSTFFMSQIINNYTNNLTDYLEGKMILNLDQAFEYFRDLGNTEYYVAINLKKGIIDENICNAIALQYVNDVLEKSIEQSKNYINYDIAFVIDQTKPKNASAILSFAIVQRSECFKFENAYALKLICSRKCFSCGNLLMGLYLYTILSHPKSIKYIKEPIESKLTNGNEYGHPVLHLGILEISGGYKNIRGLCLYTKFGFRINTKLSGTSSNCFADDNNIAMIKRFRTDELTTQNEDTMDNILKDVYDAEIERNKIISIVKRENPGYKKHVMCEFTNKSLQEKLAHLYNNLKKTQKEYAVLVSDSRMLINKDNMELKTKMEHVASEMKQMEDTIRLIEGSDKNSKLEDLGLVGGKSRVFKKSFFYKKSRKQSKMSRKRKTKRRQSKS
jgi:hypothetical protein